MATRHQAQRTGRRKQRCHAKATCRRHLLLLLCLLLLLLRSIRRPGRPSCLHVTVRWPVAVLAVAGDQLSKTPTHSSELNRFLRFFEIAPKSYMGVWMTGPKARTLGSRRLPLRIRIAFHAAEFSGYFSHSNAKQSLYFWCSAATGNQCCKGSRPSSTCCKGEASSQRPKPASAAYPA